MAAVSDDSLGQQHKELFRSVEKGDYIGNAIMDSDVCMISASGRTLLHVAVIAGNLENVEKLVKVGKDTLICMKDQHGYTALALVARYTGNTDMAKCMVETKNGFRKRLLEIQNKENVIPILIAAANGHKELTIYLYSKTPSTVFDGDDSQNRVLLLSLCITAEIFDVALKLLKRYKELPKESLSLYKFSVPKSLRGSLSLPSNESHQQSLSDKFSALVALAKMPSAFPSGIRFSRREQFIYDSKFKNLHS
ncbi:putative ankyrin repeat-containing domain-containing protein [Medicago truncatula]|uniref:Putative ankyrin repeat-containing domain-containing protein n=1 Tax=Medicago truncatula TaxID=3880 RepID=A0A396HQL9_MEDTR|nr:putative ankyrin repeat-containing domain-containing protein [Medicago truncatula]